MAYTKGPWKENAHGDIIGNHPDDWDGKPIIECDSGHYGPFDDDRKLILAAPELLDALQLLLEGYDDRFDGIESDREDDYLRRKVLAVIAKATGK